MADEEKNSTEEQNSDAPVEEQQDAGQEAQEEESPSGESQEQSDSSSQDDRDAELKAELERERERRRKAEEKAADTAYRKREQKRKGEFGEEEQEEDDSSSGQITKEDLMQLEQRLTKQQQEREAREIARTMASSDTEAELVLEYYQNRITPTGNLREDMESAYAIANRKRLLRQPQEQQRVQESKSSAQTGDASGTRRRNASEPNVSSGDQAFLATSGMTWNPQSARYEGKHTWYDPKTDESGRL